MGITGLPLVHIVFENPLSFFGALDDYSQPSVNCFAFSQSFPVPTPVLSLIPISNRR